MNFSFDVGEAEKHTVDFSWDKMLGVARVSVDGAKVLQSKSLALGELAQLIKMSSLAGKARYFLDLARTKDLNVELIRGWTVEVGQAETHVVSIFKERPRFLAAFRAHKYRVFVDDRLLKECEGH